MRSPWRVVPVFQTESLPVFWYGSIPKCLINAQTREVKSGQNHLYGNATNQELGLLRSEVNTITVAR
jgi:hypothetical protein